MFYCDWKVTIYLPQAAAEVEVSDALTVLGGVENLTQAYFGGYTTWQADGGWEGPTGSMTEPTVVIETVTHRQDRENKLKHISDFILGHTKELEVLIIEQPITIKSYERKEYHD